MRTLSWVLLAILGVLTLAVSFISANLAYLGDYPIGDTPVAEVASGRAPVLLALRGIRGTSAAYAAAFAVLYLFIVLVPYRRGEVWSWWALLIAYLLFFVVVWLRTPLLGAQLGVGAALTQAGIALLGLLLDVHRLWSPASAR